MNKFQISLVALIPFILIIAIIMYMIYHRPGVATGTPILGSKMSDIKMWVGSLLGYYLITLGIMYI